MHIESKGVYYIPWRGLIVTACFTTYLIFLATTILAPVLTPRRYFGVHEPIFGNSSSEHTQSFTKIDPWHRCELPKYDIWDDNIIPYLNPEFDPYPDCDKSVKPMTFLENGIWGVADRKLNVTCRARCHWRKSERSNIIGNWSYTPGKVDCEILEAVCSKNDTDVYGYLHTQIIPTPKKTPTVKINESQQYDVTVILLDSLSFSQARRSLLRTMSYMTNHMEAVLFPYINKVGDNSRPNGAALYFGKLLEKLDRSLFDKKNVPSDWSHEYMCQVYKDNESSLFSEFQNYGYKTLLAEDWAEGTLNWPNCKGFDNPPIDHNMRPFQNAMERRNHGELVIRLHSKQDKLCREHHHTLLDYLKQFFTAYPDQNKFSWIWPSVLGHDMENGFQHSDKDFHSFLVQYRKQLENSFVFFMGDHGLRFGGIRKTFVGALDVNNPFLAVSIPKKLRQTTDLLKIMKENAQKIQTHFDTRATMLDILKYQPSTNFTETHTYEIPGEKGYSFLRHQPETERNCGNLPVPIQYCICQFNKTNLPTDTKIALSLGKAVTTVVNEELEEGNFTNDCIEMKFDHVVSLLGYDAKFKGSTLYTVEVEMKTPSSARFKANAKILPNNEIKVMGMVERSNMYGKTANCINSEHHRPFCYCKNIKNSKAKGKFKGR